jgi:hypothetical protein
MVAKAFLFFFDSVFQETNGSEVVVVVICM